MGASHEGAWLQSSLSAAQYPDEVLNQFPFPPDIHVTYRLKAGILEMKTRVKNTGETPVGFTFGIHPYFKRPNQGMILQKIDFQQNAWL